MMKQERQEKILQILDKKDFLTVTEIATSMDVSGMTIRRDITELSNQKKLVKLFGGAQKIDILNKELSTEEKINNRVDEKIYIGTIMNSVIEDNSTIYLGAGTTIYYALPEIKKQNLFVITNSLLAFDYLIKNTNHKVILTGGEYNPITEEFIGEVAERAFDNLNIDTAFAATNGIFHNNITTSNSLEGSIQRTAFKHSKNKIIVADHSKFNVSDVFTFHRLTDIDYVISDNKLDLKTEDYYKKYVEIIKEFNP